jgi:hypothetical protein
MARASVDPSAPDNHDAEQRPTPIDLLDRPVLVA